MNASVFREPAEIERGRWRVSEAALRRLRHHLSRDRARDEAWEASSTYGVPWDVLSGLVEEWLYDFTLEGQPLFDLPCFELRLTEQRLRFVQLRSSESCALPLLLLHGYFGSVAEFQQLFGPLTEPRQHGAAKSDAFDVVCPCLPANELAGPPTAQQTARACAALMRALGYSRYAVHGSDMGANIALELAALDTEHVAALTVTAVPTYPSDTPEDLASLTSLEKSQLAGVTARYEELRFLLPESPIEALAFALAQLADSPACYDDARLRSSLLTGMSLVWLEGTAAVRGRNSLYREARLTAAPRSGVPLAVHDFPLDVASLRRFAERAHHVVEWHEHARGGSVPGLEQPELLLESLRSGFRRLR